MCQSGSVPHLFRDLGRPRPRQGRLAGPGPRPMAQVAHICRMLAHRLRLISPARLIRADSQRAHRRSAFLPELA
jgi:hypothetical protein